MKMSMKILSAGPLTTIQDFGRFGYMNSGFSPAGVMDRHSASIASLLAGNCRGDAVLEMTLFGITAVFDCETTIAISGGDFSPELNGLKIPMNSAVAVNKDDVLQMGAAKKGSRCYLAVSGGFDIPFVMDSASTGIKFNLGGFHGRKLKNGDELKFRAPAAVSNLSMRKEKYEAPQDMLAEVRAVAGPQAELFTEAGLKTFYSSKYIVSPDSDRMGMRLEGSPVETVRGSDIISDGIAWGSVQIPASGKPIIMLSDRQTTGGYAKIATVISTDIPLLAQLKPGASVSFKEISVEQAQKIAKKQERKMAALERKYIRI